MLMFAAKIYQIIDLNDLLKSLVPCDVDPYLGISDDLQVYVRPQMDIRGYGSVTDNQLATSLLLELRNKIYESDNIIMDILAQNLSSISEVAADDRTKQLSESFTPDDAFMFGPRSILEFDHSQTVSHSKESLSFDRGTISIRRFFKTCDRNSLRKQEHVEAIQLQDVQAASFVGFQSTSSICSELNQTELPEESIVEHSGTNSGCSTSAHIEQQSESWLYKVDEIDPSVVNELPHFVSFVVL